MPSLFTTAVRRFMQQAEQTTPILPKIDDPEVNQLRVDLIHEELKELEAALRKQDLVEVVDALADLQYVLSGAWVAFGLSSMENPAFYEVHDNNMSKFTDGKLVKAPNGKVLKPEGYIPVDLVPLLRTVYGNDIV